MVVMALFSALRLSTRQGILGACSCRAPKVLLFAGLSWPASGLSWKTARGRDHVAKKQQLYGRIQCMLESTDTTELGAIKMKLTGAQRKYIPEQLQLIEKAKNHGLFEAVFLLVKIGRTVYRDAEQRKKLEYDTLQTKSSKFISLQDYIAENLHECRPIMLAEIIRALGKIRGQQHSILQACEEEILHRGVSAFDLKSLVQILVALSSLIPAGTKFFEETEKAILSGQLELGSFDERAIAQTLLSYARTNNGSTELFSHFSDEILKRGLCCFKNNDLIQSLWSFSKKGFKDDNLFDQAEVELLLRKGQSDLSKSVDVAMALWAFAFQEKGSDEFFKRMERKILTSDVKTFQNDELCKVVWGFGKAGIPCRFVFSLIESEVLRRGIQMFSLENRKMLLEGFLHAKRGEKIVSSLDLAV